MVSIRSELGQLTHKLHNYLCYKKRDYLIIPKQPPNLAFDPRTTVEPKIVPVDPPQTFSVLLGAEISKLIWSNYARLIVYLVLIRDWDRQFTIVSIKMSTHCPYGLTKKLE